MHVHIYPIYFILKGAISYKSREGKGVCGLTRVEDVYNTIEY